MKEKKRKRISPPDYKERGYRLGADASAGLTANFVRVKETDLYILAPGNIEEAGYSLVHRYRNQLENYISGHPDFLTALVPLEMDSLAPPIIKDMLRAAAAADVGPMAAVAGAIAEYVGRDLLSAGHGEIIVENGGDVFLKRHDGCVAAIFAGRSPLSRKVGIRIPAERMPVGLCTSSGTVGHSLSLGRADSVTVLAPSASLADATATRLGNEIPTGSREDIRRALEVVGTIQGILGAVIICGEQMGAWGEVDLVGLD